MVFKELMVGTRFRLLECLKRGNPPEPFGPVYNKVTPDLRGNCVEEGIWNETRWRNFHYYLEVVELPLQ